MFRLTIALCLLAFSSAHRHGGRHGGDRHGCHKNGTLTTEMALKYANLYTPLVDGSFEENCATDNTPRGQYGAFFKHCTFTFLSVDDVESSSCASGTVVGEGPTSVIWPHNQTRSHHKRGHRDHHEMFTSSSDSTSKDSSARRLGRGGGRGRRHGHHEHEMVPSDRLALWPDQCVGAGPRCYPIQGDFNATLYRLFPNATWPVIASASHVQVDCQEDAIEYARAKEEFAVAEAESLARESSRSSSSKSVVAVVSLAAALFFCLVIGCVCRRRCCENCKNKSAASSSDPVKNAATNDADDETIGDLSVDVGSEDGK